MKKSLLVVYNICGISGRDNFNYYKHALSTILGQSFDDFVLVISSCRNNKEQIDELVKHFFVSPKFGFINWTDERLPVNVTFNHTTQKAIEIFGEFDDYMYIDSGVSFTEMGQLSRLYRLHKSGPNAMTAARTDTDTGVDQWFGMTDEELFKNGPYIMPVGKAWNLHAQIFSPDILEAYGNFIPDIFASYCTESTFSFVCAALRKNWILADDVILRHLRSMDGASSGFSPHNLYTTLGNQVVEMVPPWQHLFRSRRPMTEIISDPEGIKAGFGYEECAGVLVHDSEQYDENGFCKNDDLKKFIKDNIYLSQDLFDYSKIQSKVLINNGCFAFTSKHQNS